MQQLNKHSFYARFASLKITLTIILSGIINSGFSQMAIFSAQSGKWNNSLTWSGGIVPNINDTVYVQNGDTVTIDYPSACFNLNIQAGAVLVSDSSSLINLAGNWTNEGDFFAGSGTVKFIGNASQTIGGSVMTVFTNMEVSSTSTVSLLSDQYLTGILYLNSGIFSTNGYAFTLYSDFNTTASIAQIQAGADIIGDVTVQRYVNSGTAGWRLLGSPVNKMTLSDWDDDFGSSGFPGSSSPSSFCSISPYNESAPGIADSGYVMPAGLSDTVEAGKGYRCYVNSSPLTIDMIGKPVKFNHNFGVTFTPSAGKKHDGWNLLSNPYPSAIDWTSNGWTKTNLNQALYTWNPDLNQYSVYVDGISANGGSNVINSSQGFWVKASQANPVLSCGESVKTNSNSVYQKTNAIQSTSKSIVKLTLGGGNNYSDETFVCFSSSATHAFDDQEDAFKLFSDDVAVGSLSTVIDSTDLAVNCYPVSAVGVSIPVRVKVGITGKYIINRDTNLALPAGTCVYLEDLVTDSIINFNTAPSYSFIINDTTKAPRFLLHIGAPITKSCVTSSCFYTTNGKAILNGGIGKWSATWKDQLGNTLSVHNNVTGSDTLSNLAPGKYLALISSTLGCTSFNDTIFVAGADSIKSVVTATNSLCSNVGSGKISVNSTTGGKVPYFYSWSNGANTSVITGLNNGVYTLVVTDANNCKDTSYYAVSAISNLSVGFVATADTLFPVSTSTVGFNNFTTGQTSLLWDFGDGTNSSVFSPVHSYTVPGFYTISLIAGDSMCVDTSQASAWVLSPTAINSALISGNSVFVYNSESGPIVKFDLEEEKQAEIKIVTLDGKMIRRKILNVQQYSEQVETESLSGGMYLLEVTIEDKSLIKKFTK